MANFSFYNDAALTSLVNGVVPIGEGTITKVYYFGSTDDTLVLQDAVAPGTDPIYVTIVDANPGSGAEASWVKVATTLSGLDSATPGASVSIGLSVYGGAGNSIPVYVRFVNSLSGTSSSLDLSIKTSTVKEFTF
jgi:hypothetical protein